jgi:hypothetical protein
MNSIINFLTHQRTAIATIAVAVLLAVGDGLKQGHIVWQTIGYAALTALAGVAKSALSTPDGTDASTGTGS